MGSLAHQTQRKNPRMRAHGTFHPYTHGCRCAECSSAAISYAMSGPVVQKLSSGKLTKQSPFLVSNEKVVPKRLPGTPSRVRPVKVPIYCLPERLHEEWVVYRIGKKPTCDKHDKIETPDYVSILNDSAPGYCHQEEMCPELGWDLRKNDMIRQLEVDWPWG